MNNTRICDHAFTLLTSIDANYSRRRRHRAQGDVVAENTARLNIQTSTDSLDRLMQSGEPYSAAVRSILSAEDTEERPWLEGLLA